MRTRWMRAAAIAATAVLVAAAGATAAPDPRGDAALEALVRRVSDPASPWYRHYVPLRELRRRFRIPPASAPAPGPGVRSAAEVRLPPRTGTAGGCEAGRSVPVPDPALAARFPGTRALTPGQVRTALGFEGLHRRGLRGQGVRIAVGASGGVRRADLEAFGACFGIPVPEVRTVVAGALPPGTPAGGGVSVEATLDVQAIMIAAPGAAIDLVVAEGIGDMLAGALDPRLLSDPPDVISISYGICEPTFAQLGRVSGQYGAAGRRTVDRLARVAAAAGISVVAAAGDAGSTACLTPAAFAPPVLAAPVAAAVAPAVQYPASSPAVTAVGGVSLTLGADNRIRSARAWNDAEDGLPVAATAEGLTASGGGGGASRHYVRPFYQSGLGGTGMRAVPDVSMLADGIPGVAIHCGAWDPAAGVDACPPNPATGGPWIVGGGTSLATPLLAGALALADQAAARAGDPPVGFLNPLLYASTGRGAVRDVVRGDNALLPVGCCAARRGHDTATGWGVADAAGLVRAADAAWTTAGLRARGVARGRGAAESTGAGQTDPGRRT